ncbi:WD40-repeat-containing domain protein [Glomus cerebriforme]|uniref:Pre-mRNA-processing factor 19 n=1 Tax=Glomus cerebriforme TaxID=658196 RepID=A0A397ST44_9GLOM|nr:WD40-repeat-containing domain protein [Glomus cerebriforme]RIA88892.1 WD40-repeat-containing domain protein [Glomus cerebriforme]
MFCAISGEPPQDPVVSKKTGQVYEKRLIIKYIADYGKDPITGEEITEDDLLEIKASPKTVKPRPATLTSIPSLLSVFQNEWDSLMLETFTLKQQYQQVRQELSQALYQHDAACRVIARLMKERDAAREALANVQAHIAIKPPPEAAAAEGQMMEVEEQEKGINDVVINKLNETSTVLSKNRKKRKPPPELTSVDTIKNFTQISSISSLHTSTTPGITSMDVDQTEQLILTGGNDKKALIINIQEGKVTSQLKGHTKKITDVLWLGNPNEEGYDTAFTASVDKNIRIWQKSDKDYKSSAILSVHSAEVTGISVHATKDYLVSVSNDSTWAFHDIHTTQTLAKIESNDVINGYSTVEIHPDGLILGTGTNDSIVRIWDIKMQKNVTSFTDHTGRITSIAFSENGYYLATASECNAVKLWDLRKLLNFYTIQLDEGTKVNKVCWDYSGQYLGVCGTDVRIYQAKTWNQLAVFNDNTAEATDLKFGELAKTLYVSGLDRTVRFYGDSTTGDSTTEE